MRASVIAMGLLFALRASAGSWAGRIMDVRSGSDLSSNELALALARADIVVMGEQHYTPAVQIGEADVLASVVKVSGVGPTFTLGWEFLNVTQQAQVQSLYRQFAAGALSADDFLKQTQGNSVSGSYAPVLDTLKAFSGTLIGVNLTREEKAPVVSGGLRAADPSLIPPGFEMGDADYRARFVAAMSDGHAAPAQMENYFEAQCLTDDVMAESLLRYGRGLRFLITGDFHTDYFDGVVRRIGARAPGLTTRLLRFVDASQYAEKDLLPLLHDAKYGDLADFVYFVNEPNPQPTQGDSP